MTNQTNPTQSSEPVAWCVKTILGNVQCLSVHKETTEELMWPGDVLMPLFTHPSPLPAINNAEVLDALNLGLTSVQESRGSQSEIEQALNIKQIRAAIERLNKLEGGNE